MVRVPARIVVEVRDRLTAFQAETEDVGPGGCQLLSPRAVEVGRELKLALRSPGLRWAAPAAGRVVWARADQQIRLGIVFTSRLDPAFFEALVPGGAVAAARATDRLPAAAVLWLGEPPLEPSLSPEELIILRRIGAGIAVETLVRALGPSFDRVRGTLFRLLASGWLTTSHDAAVSPERWRNVLAAAEAALPSRGVRVSEPGTGASRPPAAQRLYDEGVAHLNAGRLAIAVARFNEALTLTPWDESIAGAVRRLGPWAR
jgi:PilZ domain-containing protein